jgi:hypothetical protein
MRFRQKGLIVFSIGIPTKRLHDLHIGGAVLRLSLSLSALSLKGLRLFDATIQSFEKRRHFLWYPRGHPYHFYQQTSRGDV